MVVPSYIETVNKDLFMKPYTNTLSTNKKVPTCFLNTQEVSELTGLSLPTVRKLFHKRDFPAIRYARPMVVEMSAFIQYFSVPRTKLED